MSDVERAGTYEVYIDVRHHAKHCDDWEEREGTALKLVDTGDPKQMVADALRGFAAEIAPEVGDVPRSVDSIYAALDRRRVAILREYDHTPLTRDTLLRELDSLAGALGLESRTR